MKVVLLKDVKGLGRKNDVKEVSDGYVRNFLIPKNLVKVATSKVLEEVAKIKSALEREEEADKKHLVELAKNLEDRPLRLKLRTDENGHLFGSVNKEVILKSLRDSGLITSERTEVKLDHPIKELGDYVVPIELNKGVRTEIKLIIERLPE